MMAAVRTLEDFIHQRMTIDGCKRLSVVLRVDGLFEAALVHRDGSTSTVDVDADPATALWNTMVPLTMRRKLPSGREAVQEPPQNLSAAVAQSKAARLDDLLGDDPPIIRRGVAADIGDLLG